MSAFVITRIDSNSKVSYWDDTGRWVLRRKNATRFAWSWAHEVIKEKYLRAINPRDTIQVEAAPEQDMDIM